MHGAGAGDEEERARSRSDRKTRSRFELRGSSSEVHAVDEVEGEVQEVDKVKGDSHCRSIYILES